MSARLSSAEREALKNPDVARGAAIEGAFRKRRQGVHTRLSDTLDALAESHQDWSTPQILAALTRIYGKPRKRSWGGR